MQLVSKILFFYQACAAERATYTFVCSVCKARFKYKNHMRRHEDSHNNVRRYNCEVCTTAFLRPDHLKVRKQILTCNFNVTGIHLLSYNVIMFLTYSFFQRHMMRMHGIVQLPIQSTP